ncbi:MAG: putative ABC transporter permease [Firmicutes bacterium]|nr:putative ABC transporter permease [Bacillota bacterium]
MITRFIIYGAIGCLMEVFWTGLGSLINKNFTLTSKTSLWMFFIYGSVVVLEPVFRFLAPVNFLLRGLIYASFILFGEFMTGTLLKRADICPWDYSHTRFSVRGVVRFDYLPAWGVAGLFFEQVYWWLV